VLTGTTGPRRARSRSPLAASSPPTGRTATGGSGDAAAPGPSPPAAEAICAGGTGSSSAERRPNRNRKRHLGEDEARRSRWCSATSWAAMWWLLIMHLILKSGAARP